MTVRFLIDADLPRSANGIVRANGYDVVDVRDIGFRSAKDSEIASYAQYEGFCIITGDYDFADIRNYPPHQYNGLVVLSLPRTATAKYINKLLDGFLKQRELIVQIPGKLAIVEPGRIRLRES
ncbi:MAG: hypothetical protein FJ010_04275 [Chloroflexi bacterium]|nr:hypothetical protein [Chloroflexota bacterium]